jgi:hypothetical protein
MFEKCIQISGSFVPAYLGLSKIQTGISSVEIHRLLLKALRFNEESPIVRLELADWLYAKSKYEQNENAFVLVDNMKTISQIQLFSDLYIEALKHYTLGIQHESSLQTSFMAGALKTLRSLGHRERSFQFVLR